MGWSYGPKPPEGQKAYCDKQLTWENDRLKSRVLDSAMCGFKEYYAAVEHLHADGTREVWCAVFMLNFIPNDRDFPFGYKGMTESMGPYICNAPARILDLLTPTDNECANKWREQCRANIRKRQAVTKINPGDTFTYQDDQYRLLKKRPWIAQSVSSGQRYRFTRSAKMCIQA